MPQHVQNHPTQHELASFALGKLDLAEAEPISTHVADCELCSGTLAALESDTFLELVPSRGGAAATQPYQYIEYPRLGNRRN